MGNVIETWLNAAWKGDIPTMKQLLETGQVTVVATAPRDYNMWDGVIVRSSLRVAHSFLPCLSSSACVRVFLIHPFVSV